jgi:hypothetical protein
VCGEFHLGEFVNRFRRGSLVRRRRRRHRHRQNEVSDTAQMRARTHTARKPQTRVPDAHVTGDEPGRERGASHRHDDLRKR